MAKQHSRVRLAGSTSAIKVGPCSVQPSGTTVVGALKQHGRGTGRRVPIITSQVGDWSQASYLAFLPLCLPPSFSPGGSSPHHVLPSPVVCARDSEEGDKKRVQGSGRKKGAEEGRRRTTFTGMWPDSPCVQIKGVGVRKEMSPKECCVVGSFTADPQVPSDTRGNGFWNGI